MPLIQSIAAGSVEIGIWRITEQAGELRSRLNLNQREEMWLQSIKGEGRRREWLASRCLIKQMLGNIPVHIYKDKFGKPYLQEHNRHISISHSNELCAVILSTQHVGIDIQRKVSKIERIKERFLNAWELHTLHPDYDIDSLHHFWSAKECIYKIYGRKRVDFRQHMTVDLVNLVGYFHRKDDRFESTLFFNKYEEYFLTYALQRN